MSKTKAIELVEECEKTLSSYWVNRYDEHGQYEGDCVDLSIIQNGFDKLKKAIEIALEPVDWVKCSERLPDEHGDACLLVADGFDTPICGWWNEATHSFFADDMSEPIITHWMPLPLKPKE